MSLKPILASPPAPTLPAGDADIEQRIVTLAGQMIDQRAKIAGLVHDPEITEALHIFWSTFDEIKDTPARTTRSIQAKARAVQCALQQITADDGDENAVIDLTAGLFRDLIGSDA